MALPTERRFIQRAEERLGRKLPAGLRICSVRTAAQSRQTVTRGYCILFLTIPTGGAPPAPPKTSCVRHRRPRRGASFRGTP
jgi:hypothetical protein